MTTHQALEAAARAATRLKARADAYNDRSGSYAYIGDDVSLDDEAARAILSLLSERDALAAENERLLNERNAAVGRATDYRTVAINAGWNWSLCDAYGREEYQKQRGEHVDACALNAAESRARALTQGDSNAG